MSTVVTVRMYNQGNLGDCFLLKFSDGEKSCHYLIDFGSYERGNDAKEIEIAESIAEAVDGEPLRIVLTHQHQDHLSGFISAASIFEKLNIAETWFSYLDDPQNLEAEAVRQATVKFWNKNKKNKDTAKNLFGQEDAVDRMLKAKEGFDLFAEGQTGGKAITNLRAWSKNRSRFLLPGQQFNLPGLPINTVKVYVLGPPTDADLLRKLNPSSNEVVDGLNASLQLMNLETSVNLMVDALDTINAKNNSANNFPFHSKFSKSIPGQHPLENAYKQQAPWRQIDYDWLSEMGRVSLHMDTLTNNSSLVLAFEIVETGKVLLFAADAQIGNWKSWDTLKFKGTRTTTADLLSRTVLYKAGHHSSLNATLAQSLEPMNSEELVIMIPVNEKVSNQRGFHMLMPGMMRGYNRKSCGRILRSDTGYHKSTARYFKFPFAKAPEDFFSRLTIKKNGAKKAPFYIEYVVA